MRFGSVMRLELAFRPAFLVRSPRKLDASPSLAGRRDEEARKFSGRLPDSPSS